MELTKQRSVGICILLTFLTCGIYGLFWLYSIINDVCILRGKQKTGGTDILLSLVTCGLYTIYLMYKIGNEIDMTKQERGISGSGSNGILYLLLSIFGLGLIAYALAQSSINELS